MIYNKYLIQITEAPEVSEERYTVVCLRAERYSLTLNGIRCYLDGNYLLCLNPEDKMTLHGGHCEALALHFLPYFYNVNLNHEIISLNVYEEMRQNHGYPDFHLFRIRDNDFFGILPLTEDEYKMILDLIRSAGVHIDEHDTDAMWSCRARSELISILQIAESAYLGKKETPDNEILRYIKEHLGEDITLQMLCDRFHTNRTTLGKKIKALTGLAPLQYIMEEKLTQSRPDLLFTNIPLEDIAAKYGFYDSNYFIRMFKKRFGISPRQFRMEGQSERIRNEHIYREKANTMLQVERFEKDISRGLGRAILFLRNEPDKTPYRKAVLDLMSGGVTSGRALYGQYETDLIKSFPDWELMAAEVVPPLLDAIRQGEKTSSIPMLVKLGFKEKAREALEELYRQSYAELVAYTKENKDSIERYPDCSRRYFMASAAFGRFLKAERERIKAILLDIADLYYYSDTPVIPTYQNPLFSIMDGIGKSTLFAIADEVAAEHPHGSKMHPAKNLLSADEPTVNPNITPREIMEAGLQSENYPDLWVSFKAAPSKVIRKVAKEIILQVNAPAPDMEQLIYLMSFFDKSIDPDILPPQFPLDPTPILQFAEQKRAEETERLSAEKNGSGIDQTHPLFLVYSFLSGIRHPAIRTFFTDVLCQKIDLPFIRRDCAIRAVWRTNFTPFDSEELERFVRSASGFDRSVVFDEVIGLIRDQREGISCKLIQYLFENTRFMMRRWLVMALCDTGRLWEDSLVQLREECLLDEDEKIRNLVLARNENSLDG